MANLDDTPKAAKRKVALKVSSRRSGLVAESEEDRKSLGQVRKTFALLAVVAVAYVVYLVFTGQIDDLVSSLAGVDMAWIVAGVVCFLFYYVFGVLAYVLSIVADPDCPVGLRDLMSVEASGVFFMRMTPNGAGTQPAQIFRLTRAGLSVGAAGAMNFTRTVLYEAAEGIFAGIMLIFRGAYFYETFGDVTLIGLFLFGFKIVQVAVILAISLLPRPVVAISNWGLRLAHRHRWIKDDKYEQYSNFVNTQIGDFSRAFKESAAHVGEMCVTMVVSLLQLGCMYALPYFVLRSFGEPADFLTCLASGSLLELLINAVPLPGGTGGAEVGFTYLFQNMFGSHTAAGMVIWRAVEYLLPVVIAAPCMGLRSSGEVPIARRWQQMSSRIDDFFGGADMGKKGRGSGPRGGSGGRAAGGRGGVTVRPASMARKKAVVSGGPAGGSDVAARIAAGKAAAAAKKAAAGGSGAQKGSGAGAAGK